MSCLPVRPPAHRTRGGRARGRYPIEHSCFQSTRGARMIAPSSPGISIAVVKIGGSVLTGPLGYRHAARFIASRVADEPGVRLLVVVSAERGETDRLLDTARATCASPDPIRPCAICSGRLASCVPSHSSRSACRRSVSTRQASTCTRRDCSTRVARPRPRGHSSVPCACSNASPRTTSSSRPGFWHAGTATRSCRSAEVGRT